MNTESNQSLSDHNEKYACKFEAKLFQQKINSQLATYFTYFFNKKV